MKKTIVCLLLLIILLSCKTTEKKADDVKSNKSSEQNFTQFIYIQQVLNYTMDDVGKNVELENQDYYLLLKTGMIFELKIKSENKTIKGRWGYQLDISSKEGLMYFLVLENPESMSKDDFLNKSNYTKKSDIILVPIAATENSVSFIVKESKIKFNINKLIFNKAIK